MDGVGQAAHSPPPGCPAALQPDPNALDAMPMPTRMQIAGSTKVWPQRNPWQADAWEVSTSPAARARC